MSQEPIRDRLLDALDAPDQLPRELREHLVADAADRRWWHQTQLLHARLGALGACEPPAEAVAATLRRAERAAERAAHRRALRAFPRWAQAISAAATAAVVLLTVGLLLLGGRPTPPHQPQVTAPPPAQRVVYEDYSVPQIPIDTPQRTPAETFRVIVPDYTWHTRPQPGAVRADYLEDTEEW
jgi:hypothetical protein